MQVLSFTTTNDGELFDLLVDGQSLLDILGSGVDEDSIMGIPYYCLDEGLPTWFRDREEYLLVGVCSCGVVSCGSVGGKLTRSDDSITCDFGSPEHVFVFFARESRVYKPVLE